MSPVLNQSPTNACAVSSGRAQWQTHCPEFVMAGRVHGNNRRSFGEPVSFMNPDTHARIPLGEVSAQWRASRDKNLDPPSHAFADSLEYQAVRQLPTAGHRDAACEGIFNMGAAHR